MPTIKRNVLIHLQYMQSVTGGHLTTVEGWSRSHGLPFEHLKEVNVYTDGTAIFALQDVYMTHHEREKILPRLEYLIVLGLSYVSYTDWTINRFKSDLRKKYETHLRQKNEEKKKAADIYEETTGFSWKTIQDPRPKTSHAALQQPPVTYYDVLFHNRYAQALGMTFDKFVCQYIDSYIGSDAAMIVTDGCGDCDGVAVTRLKMCKIREVSLPAWPVYAVAIPENTQPFSEAGKLHSKYFSEAGKLHSKYREYIKDIAGDFLFNTKIVGTHRTSSRKQGKALQQEHAARVAHFEAEAKKEAESLGLPDLDPNFCNGVLDGMCYLTGLTPSFWPISCRNQREYDFAIHSIMNWVKLCGKDVRVTHAANHYSYINVGSNRINLSKTWKHEGNIGQ